jgi:hypothetical protein
VSTVRPNIAFGVPVLADRAVLYLRAGGGGADGGTQGDRQVSHFVGVEGVDLYLVIQRCYFKGD